MADSKVRNSTTQEQEIWKPINGYENRYAISNKGRVKSLERLVKTPNRPDFKIKEKIMSTKSRAGRGYPVVNLWKNNNRSICYIHRLVAEAFIPNPENKPCINHVNGVKTNNHIENLEWVTYSENHLHAYKNGFKKITKKHKAINSIKNRGSNHGNSVLTEKDVREIRNKYKGSVKRTQTGISMREIANQYNVCRKTVANIINRVTWRHVD